MLMLKDKNPYWWIPTLYFMQGFPYALVSTISLIIYKNLHFTNAKITFYTSLFTIAWFLKPLFAPFLENSYSKRVFIVGTQLAICLLLISLVFSLMSQYFFHYSMVIFCLMAFFSAIHDIKSDGLYIATLERKIQAKFVGIKTIFYQFGRLFCQFFAVYASGVLFKYFDVQKSWEIVLACLAGFVFLIVFYHYYTLKNEAKINITDEFTDKNKNFMRALKDFFAQKNCILIVLFILLYNLPENQVIKILPLFMLDKSLHGGLALNNETVALINGVVSFIAMLVGVILSGFFLKKYLLKKCLVPMTILSFISYFLYFIISIYQIKSFFMLSFLISISQFFYGLCNSAYMFFILEKMGKGKYAMSFYALGTSLMMLSMMLSGAISGFIQTILGYSQFFMWIIFIGFVVLTFTFYVSSHGVLEENQ